jgi:hypothetical protein
MLKKKIFLFFFYVGMISFVNAQVKKISGKILNNESTPLSSVTVKGTKTSNQSMNEGNFTVVIHEKES